MLLSFLIVIPLLSSLLSYFLYRFKEYFSRWIALIATISVFLIILRMWFQKQYCSYQFNELSIWNNQFIMPWIPKFGIEFNLFVDGLSLLMLFLTCILSIIAILVSWKTIKKYEGFFYFNFLMLLSGTIGVFISRDLFLFFFFWEIILIPTYFLVSLWGKNIDQKNACVTVANKFFIYMQVSGLFMFISILILVYSYYKSTNILTFNYDLLSYNTLDINTECIVLLGFFLACFIKMPIVPFHGWLPDFHVQSLSCGTVEIIGLLFKTAPYALLRISLVLCPHATEKFVYFVIIMGMTSVFYGSILAFSQNNVKKLIAYSSISHMGLILISIYSKNEISLQGAVVQMLSSSFCTAALCILSGYLYTILHTQDIRKMGGLWSCMYWIPGLTLFFSLSNFGLPGTGNFVGEFLILLGLFQIHPILSVLLTVSILFSALYSLNLVQRISYGVCKQHILKQQIYKKDLFIMMMLISILVFLGLCPQKILDISYFPLHDIYQKFMHPITAIRC